jgi:Trypsin-like peptidase domain
MLPFLPLHFILHSGDRFSKSTSIYVSEMFPFDFSCFVFFSELQQEGKKEGSSVAFSPWDHENAEVPEYVRKSTVLLPEVGCTGTFGTFPWGVRIVTAGHCFTHENGKKKDNLNQSILFCHSMSGEHHFVKKEDFKVSATCKTSVLKFLYYDAAKDFAFLSTDANPILGLAPADLDFEPTLLKGSEVYAAGYGDGLNQRSSTTRKPTEAEKKSYDAALNKCKELELKCESCDSSNNGCNGRCTKEDSNSYIKCNEAGGALAAESVGGIESMDFLNIADDVTFKLRGGTMLIFKSEMSSFNKNTAGEHISNLVGLTVRAKGSAISSQGDTGTGWWMNKKLVGVHFLGDVQLVEDEKIPFGSAFRSLKYYLSIIPAGR